MIKAAYCFYIKIFFFFDLPFKYNVSKYNNIYFSIIYCSLIGMHIKPLFIEYMCKLVDGITDDR